MAVPTRLLRHRQRGLALITAVLVVAAASVAATAMVVSQQYSVRRTASLLHGEQAEAYGFGAESWAKVLLRRDAKESTIDTLEEDWAQPLAPVMVEGGTIEGFILDQQARFNVNNLVVSGAVDEDALDQFQRLLDLLDLDSSLAFALADWLDPDAIVRFPNGAEDDAYLSLTPAYRTANGPMRDISELRLVKGFDAKAVAALAPHLTALPAGTDINVNTASAEVVASLAAGVSVNEAQGLLDDRGEDPFADVAAFKGHSLFAGRPVEVGVAVTSEYFRVQGRVQVGERLVWMSSLVWRDGSDLHLVARSRVLPVAPAAGS